MINFYKGAVILAALLILNSPIQENGATVGLLPTATVYAPKPQLLELKVIATGYNSLPNQTDDSPFITATGDSVFWGGIAVSRPLLNDSLLPYGSVVKVEGYDTPFIVFDTMNKRFQNYKIDLWFQHLEDAWGYGVNRGLKVTKIGKLPKARIPEFKVFLASNYYQKQGLL